jgi:SAM-dependent methyltransferase
MYIPAIRGLKYPDESLIRFFFKNNLQNQKGNVLEFGAENGNNLLLFYEYGWNVTGVDISEKGTDDANANFADCKKQYSLSNTSEFILSDMGKYAKEYKGTPFDILLLPGCFYYTDIFEIHKLLENINRNKLLKEGGLLFIRYRSTLDYRFGKGEKIGEKTFKFDFDETGELGCINTFFTKDDLINLYSQYFELSDIIHLKSNFENLQKGVITDNYDYVFWAKIKNKQL